MITIKERKNIMYDVPSDDGNSNGIKTNRDVYANALLKELYDGGYAIQTEDGVFKFESKEELEEFLDKPYSKENNNEKILICTCGNHCSGSDVNCDCPVCNIFPNNCESENINEPETKLSPSDGGMNLDSGSLELICQMLGLQAESAYTILDSNYVNDKSSDVNTSNIVTEYSSLISSFSSECYTTYKDTSFPSSNSSSILSGLFGEGSDGSGYLKEFTKKVKDVREVLMKFEDYDASVTLSLINSNDGLLTNLVGSSILEQQYGNVSYTYDEENDTYTIKTEGKNGEEKVYTGREFANLVREGLFTSDVFSIYYANVTPDKDGKVTIKGEIIDYDKYVEQQQLLALAAATFFQVDDNLIDLKITSKSNLYDYYQTILYAGFYTKDGEINYGKKTTTQQELELAAASYEALKNGGEWLNDLYTYTTTANTNVSDDFKNNLLKVVAFTALSDSPFYINPNNLDNLTDEQKVILGTIDPNLLDEKGNIVKEEFNKAVENGLLLDGIRNNFIEKYFDIIDGKSVYERLNDDIYEELFYNKYEYYRVDLVNYLKESGDYKNINSWITDPESINWQELKFDDDYHCGRASAALIQLQNSQARLSAFDSLISGFNQVISFYKNAGNETNQLDISKLACVDYYLRFVNSTEQINANIDEFLNSNTKNTTYTLESVTKSMENILNFFSNDKFKNDLNTMLTNYDNAYETAFKIYAATKGLDTEYVSLFKQGFIDEYCEAIITSLKNGNTMIDSFLNDLTTQRTVRLCYFSDKGVLTQAELNNLEEIKNTILEKDESELTDAERCYKLYLVDYPEVLKKYNDAETEFKNNLTGISGDPKKVIEYLFNYIETFIPGITQEKIDEFLSYNPNVDLSNISDTKEFVESLFKFLSPNGTDQEFTTFYEKVSDLMYAKDILINNSYNREVLFYGGFANLTDKQRSDLSKDLYKATICNDVSLNFARYVTELKLQELEVNSELARNVMEYDSKSYNISSQRLFYYLCHVTGYDADSISMEADTEEIWNAINALIEEKSQLPEFASLSKIKFGQDDNLSVDEIFEILKELDGSNFERDDRMMFDATVSFKTDSDSALYNYLYLIDYYITNAREYNKYESLKVGYESYLGVLNGVENQNFYKRLGLIQYFDNYNVSVEDLISSFKIESGFTINNDLWVSSQNKDVSDNEYLLYLLYRASTDEEFAKQMENIPEKTDFYKKIVEKYKAFKSVGNIDNILSTLCYYYANQSDVPGIGNFESIFEHIKDIGMQDLGYEAYRRFATGLEEDDKYTINGVVYRVVDGKLTDKDGNTITFADENFTFNGLVSCRAIPRVGSDGLFVIDDAGRKVSDMYIVDREGNKILDSNGNPIVVDKINTGIDFFETFGYSVVNGLEMFERGFENLFYADGQKDAYDYCQENISYYLTNNYTGLNTVYNLGTCIGNMLPTIAATYIVSAVAGPVGAASGVKWLASACKVLATATTMGLSVAGNAREEALQLGMSEGAASTYAIISAVSEVGLESLLGKIPGIRLLESNSRTFTSFLKDMASEGIEECLQTWINDATLAIGGGKEFDIKETFVNSLYDGYLGMLASGVLNGANNIVGASFDGAKSINNMVTFCGGFDTLFSSSSNITALANAYYSLATSSDITLSSMTSDENIKTLFNSVNSNTDFENFCRELYKSYSGTSLTETTTIAQTTEVEETATTEGTELPEKVEIEEILEAEEVPENTITTEEISEPEPPLTGQTKIFAGLVELAEARLAGAKLNMENVFNNISGKFSETFKNIMPSVQEEIDKRTQENAQAQIEAEQAQVSQITEEEIAATEITDITDVTNTTENIDTTKVTVNTDTTIETDPKINPTERVEIPRPVIPHRNRHPVNPELTIAEIKPEEDLTFTPPTATQTPETDDSDDKDGGDDYYNYRVNELIRIIRNATQLEFVIKYIEYIQTYNSFEYRDKIEFKDIANWYIKTYKNEINLRMFLLLIDDNSDETEIITTYKSLYPNIFK